MKLSFISTVLNEKKTIVPFLDSLISQTKKPDEIIIVDGGSNDDTIKRIKNYELRIRKSGIRFKLFVKKGNISKGRNFAVKNSTCDVIAISDAGCVLDKNWLRRIAFPFKDKSVDIVAGFYKGLPSSNFQKCLVPFVLVMPDKASKDFLPASRSMAIRKKVFEKVGGFSEKLNQAEDYDLAKRLKKSGAKIVFEKRAIVGWIPRSNIISAFKMFYKYAYGDIKAGNLRLKVLFIFARYLVALFSILAARFVSFEFLLTTIFVYFFGYSGWAIYKNYKYIKSLSALFYLPLIQFASDFAVMGGTLSYLARKILNITFDFLKKEKITSISIVAFTILMLGVINWGLPNASHPFTYHMDEWHQLQSVRNLFTHLSPNMEGSANGPVFHFALSGFYIGILSLLGLVNPFAINSSLTNLDIQNTIFVYLRLSTLFFALGSVGLLIYILKKQLKVSGIFLPVVLFLFSPVWISLSNYFKYDIALIFWILLSILLIFKFKDKPTLKNYLIAGVPIALAVSTKISALPLIGVYFLAFLIFKKRAFKYLNYPIFGGTLFLLVFLFLGIPDVILGTGDYFEYFHSNLVRTPVETFNYKLGTYYWIYLFTNQIPTLFGYVLLFMFSLSLFYFIYEALKKSIGKIFSYYQDEVFILASFLIFAASLYPLKLFIYNRSLVVLPFIILFIGIIFNKFTYRHKELGNKALVFIYVILAFHSVQGASWIIARFNDPRELSSIWIENNISSGTTIGIESPPIYQFLPDNILREYYNLQEYPDYKANYQYEVIDSKSINLPTYVIITNADIDRNFLHKSPKKELLERLDNKNYMEIITFEPNWWLSELFSHRLDYHISLLTPGATITVYKLQ